MLVPDPLEVNLIWIYDDQHKTTYPSRFRTKINSSDELSVYTTCSCENGWSCDSGKYIQWIWRRQDDATVRYIYRSRLLLNKKTSNRRLFSFDLAPLLGASCLAVNRGRGGVAEWLGRPTWNPEVAGSSPVLTTSWSCFTVVPSSTPRLCL